MTKIIRSADCGNSPKNQFAEALAIALATGDARAVRRGVTEDVEWHIAGGPAIQGKEALLQAVQQRRSEAIAGVTIHHVVTHGKAGAVNGTLEARGGEAAEFCDVYDFASAKGDRVRRITSYRIER